MTEQYSRANRVPATMNKENIYLAHPGNPINPGNQGQPLGMNTYSNPRDPPHNAGLGLSQNPTGVRTTRGQSSPVQHPGLQTQPGAGQYTQGSGNTRPLPAHPPNPSGHNSNQFQWNWSFQAFSTFDSRKFIDDETITLGAIQIIIGLMHILSSMSRELYRCAVLGYSGYLVWGGISFVVSGSLSVWTKKDPNPCVVNVNIGAHMVSAFFSLLGICILITDMIVTPCFMFYSVTIFPFAILEFCLTCVVSCFGFQVLCWDHIWNTKARPRTSGAYPASTATPVNIPTNVTTIPANTSNRQAHITVPAANTPCPSNTPLNIPNEPIYSEVANS